jgi:predicted transcriptional regulator
VQVSEIEQFVDKTFEGSIPAFIAAFSRSKKLTEEEIAQLQELIDHYRND